MTTPADTTGDTDDDLDRDRYDEDFYIASMTDAAALDGAP